MLRQQKKTQQKLRNLNLLSSEGRPKVISENPEKPAMSAISAALTLTRTNSLRVAQSNKTIKP